MIKFIASDIDGTIIGENNSINSHNIEVLDKMSTNPNITFAVCTGKSYAIFKNTYKNLKATFGIFGNGNQIIDLRTGKEIYKVVLNKSDVNYCIDIAKEKNIHIHIYTKNKIITEKLKYMDLRNYVLSKNKFYNTDLEFVIVKNIKNYINNNNEEIFQIVISIENDLINLKDEILDNRDLGICQFRKYGIYRDLIIDKEYEYLSIIPKNVDKSIAIDYLIKYLNINAQDVLTIGDNLNDINMLKNFGIGVAVSNAYDEVKSISKYITKNDVTNGGFAEAVYKFVQLG